MRRTVLSQSLLAALLLAVLLPGVSSARATADEAVVAGAATANRGSAMSEYQNDATPAEKLAALHNDLAKRREGTLLAQAIADSELSGRFGTQTQQRITGATPVPQVPRLPETHNIPWPSGPDFTGYEINAMEPVGEPHEIERSSAILRERAARSAVDPATEDAPAPPAVPASAADCAGPSETGAGRAPFIRRI